MLGGTSADSTSVQNQLASLAPGGASRLSGADRYETAAAISRSSFGPAVPSCTSPRADLPTPWAAWPRRGSMADRSSSFDRRRFGSGRRRRGPLLLVRDISLPASVRSELLRLAPQRVTILGGMSAVSESVRAEITRLLNPLGPSRPVPAPIDRAPGAHEAHAALIGADLSGTSAHERPRERVPARPCPICRPEWTPRRAPARCCLIHRHNLGPAAGPAGSSRQAGRRDTR